MGHRRHKGKQNKSDEQSPKDRRVDVTKVMAVGILTVVIVFVLWILNVKNFPPVFMAFVTGSIYGLLLPHMIHRNVH